MCSLLKWFLLIVSLKASRDSQRFRFWLRGVHFDSEVWCTPQSLTLQYDAHRGAWLHGGMHTTEGCTPRSLTPRYDAHSRAWLRGVMHTAEFYEKLGSLDSTVWCTLRSLTLWYDANRRVWLRVVQHTAESDYFENVRFRIHYVFNYIYWKTFKVKKILETICDLQYHFHNNILRHHRDITIVKFWIKTDTWQVTDSAVWCTPRSLTPQYDAHCGIRLRGGMHTAEFFQMLCFHDSAVWCTPRSLNPRDDAHHGAFLKFEYLGEIETEFENILACLSGA